MRAFRKCLYCRNYTEGEVVKDDGCPYIICEWCGVIVDLPFIDDEDEPAEEADTSRKEGEHGEG